MPARSKIEQLPEDLRKQLDVMIVTKGFSRYRDLSKWLKEQGYSISKDAVNRHGQNLEEKLDAIKASTAAARAIVEASPDDEGAMNDALMRLVQDRLFTIMLKLKELEDEDVDVTKVSLASVARSVAQLSRASVNQKKWQAEARAKVKAQVAAVEEKVDRETRAGGLTPEAASEIRKALLDVQV